ncbi:MAG TPA: hypothetical protein VFK59_11470 [Actinomycetota bacterium]|nr:hypothetical protein [Actinomycetota bacterium]
MRSERGYAGARMLAALGLVSLLVWLVPMVFLSRKQVDLVSAVTEPVAGATGETAVTEPVGALGRANDLQAQSLLNGAIRVAQVWYAENGTYAGFGPAEAAGYDPSISFTAGSPAPGTVTIRVAPDAVVMVTIAGDGGYLCAAANLDVVTFGRADAATAQDCQSGW